MFNILTIIGARPQIIKAAALSRAVSLHNSNCSESEHVREWILHTGQHYDENMSGVFFDELGIPRPDWNLGLGGGTRDEQIERMTKGIGDVLRGEIRFDAVVLYGDTNSTYAGAVAAHEAGIPLFHVEAGLRSYNMEMPEELNRLKADELSDVLFAPTQTAVDNLAKEKVRGSVEKVGDVMYDNMLHFINMAPANRFGDYILATVHRQENTDDPGRLENIFDALASVSESVRVVIPLHPRTAKMLQRNPSLDAKVRRKLTIVPPASFLETIALERDAKLVVTDSGGVQKESFFLSRPSVILREETEWTEIVEAGAGILAGCDKGRILSAVNALTGCEVAFPQLFGDGAAAEKILKIIIGFNKMSFIHSIN